MNIKKIQRRILDKRVFHSEVGTQYLGVIYSTWYENLYRVDCGAIGPPLLLYDKVADTWMMLEVMREGLWGRDIHKLTAVHELIPESIQAIAIFININDIRRVISAQSITGLL